MKYFTILLLFIISSLYSQNTKKELRIPYRVGNLWGLCDTLGVVKIKPFADEISYFKINENFEGKYIVRVNNTQKIIDNEANILLENKDYDSISIVYFDHAIEVYKKGKVGVFINGRELIPCQYDGIHETQNGSYKVFKNDKIGLINSSGKLIIPIEYYSLNLSEKMQNKADKFIWTAITKSGKRKEYFDDKIITKNILSLIEVQPNISEESNHKIINDLNIKNNLNEILKKYYYARDIIEGKFVIVENENVSAKTIEESKKVGVVRIIDKQEIIPLEYSGISYITNEHGKSIFEVRKNNLSNFIDENKKNISPINFDDSMKYNESIYIIKKDNKWGAKIFHTNYPYIPIKYESIDLVKTITINKNWSFNIFEVELNNKKGYIGENGVEYFKN